MSSEPIEHGGSGQHDDTPMVMVVLSGGRLDGRLVRMREGDMPAGLYTQSSPDWSAYLTADLANGEVPPIPPPDYWRWTGRTDSHGRAVFERARPEG